MKKSIRLLTSFIALSFAGLVYAGDKTADSAKKECCGCSECKECKAGNCCCSAEKKPASDKKPAKSEKKPAK
jgi:hypothetical protein